MPEPRRRSASVTAAATLAILGSVSALFFWGSFFLSLLNLPPDKFGRHVYQTNTLAFLLLTVVPSTLIALGIQTGIGLFRLRSWARPAALIWASLALVFCLIVIAFRPFETFFIPEEFVSDLTSLKQLIVVSFLILLFPISVWWLFLFRTKSVVKQFAEPTPEVPEPSSSAQA
jgi:hypothetical protein